MGNCWICMKDDSQTTYCDDCGNQVCKSHSKKVHDGNQIKIFCNHCVGNAKTQFPNIKIMPNR